MNHSSQYKICKEEGFLRLGEWKTDTAYRWLKDGKWHYGTKDFRSQEILCGRFGGACSNQHIECKKLRGTYEKTN